MLAGVMRGFTVGYSQYHLAVAGGCAARFVDVFFGFAPTRYREVVLTASKLNPELHKLTPSLRNYLKLHSLICDRTRSHHDIEPAWFNNAFHLHVVEPEFVGCNHKINFLTLTSRQ